MSEDRRPKIVYIVTAVITADVLLEDQLKYINNNLGDVTLICPGGARVQKVVERENVDFFDVPFRRDISLVNDLYCLFRLIFILFRIKPDLVNYSTPKASLLGSISTTILGIKNRIYLLRGLRFETENGFKGKLLKSLEHLTSFLSTHIVSISASVQEKHKTLFPRLAYKNRVLGLGSSNGLDLEALSTEDFDIISFRAKLGIDKNTIVLGYVGRLNEDKGIELLLDTFACLTEKELSKEVCLVLIGDYDGSETFVSSIKARIERDSKIKFLGFIKDIAKYYRIMDLFVFPSYREGFGNVLIEASYCKLPVVAFDVTGVRNAVQHSHTGMLVPFRDTNMFLNKILYYLDNPEEAMLHGSQGHDWVKNNFNRKDVIQSWKEYYQTVLIGKRK